MKVFKTVFIIFLMLLITSCQNKELSKESVEQKINNNKGNNSVGITLGLTDESAVSNKNFTHIIKENDIYTPNLHLINRFPNKNKYRVFFLVDYRQKEVIYENKKQNYIDIELNAQEDKRFSVKIEELNKGLHDLLVIVIRNPDSLLSKEEYLPSGSNFLHRRVSLIVNNDLTKPNIAYKPFEINDSLNFKLPLIVTKEPRKQVSGVVTTLITSKVHEKHWLNFAVTNSVDYLAIIGFTGKEQIDLDYPFIDINSKKGMLHFPVNLNDSHNKENTFFAVIENPFYLREDLDGNMVKTPSMAYFTNKISINY
jgi:hypothetical protein